MQIGLAGRGRTERERGTSVQSLFRPTLGSEWGMSCRHLGRLSWMSTNRTWGPRAHISLVFTSPTDLGVSLLQEDARTDAVDSVVRDIQNTQCLLNVEHLSAGCPHVTLQFADSKGDVGLGLVKEGLVMVEVRKEKQFQKVVRDVEAGHLLGERPLASPPPPLVQREAGDCTKSQ